MSASHTTQASRIAPSVKVGWGAVQIGYALSLNPVKRAKWLCCAVFLCLGCDDSTGPSVDVVFSAVMGDASGVPYLDIRAEVVPPVASSWVLVDENKVLPKATGTTLAGNVLWLQVWRPDERPLDLVLTVTPAIGKRKMFRYLWE